MAVNQPGKYNVPTIINHAFNCDAYPETVVLEKKFAFLKNDFEADSIETKQDDHYFCKSLRVKFTLLGLTQGILMTAVTTKKIKVNGPAGENIYMSEYASCLTNIWQPRQG